jgi:NTP pyrophosphatase (non-canonical NTP hydrolase)
LELFEAIHLLVDSKTHRQTLVGGFDRTAFIEELVDVLHYFIEICLLSGISSNELAEAYMKKSTKNFARISRGY